LCSTRKNGIFHKNKNILWRESKAFQILKFSLDDLMELV